MNDIARVLGQILILGGFLWEALVLVGRTTVQKKQESYRALVVPLIKGIVLIILGMVILVLSS